MILVELPTKTIALIVAMAVIGLFIVAGIIVTLVITQSERFNKQKDNDSLISFEKQTIFLSEMTMKFE